MQYDDVITNPRWRTDAILKIVLWLYLGAILADQREIWIGNEQSHADIGHMTKTAIFENSKWRTATILKIALSPYLSCKLSDLIKFGMHIQISISRMDFLTKIWNFANSRWRTDAILKIVFGYISAPYWPINVKFGSEMKNHIPIQVTWPKLHFSKIQDGGRPPFWK